MPFASPFIPSWRYAPGEQESLFFGRPPWSFLIAYSCVSIVVTFVCSFLVFWEERLPQNGMYIIVCEYDIIPFSGDNFGRYYAVRFWHRFRRGIHRFHYKVVVVLV